MTRIITIPILATLLAASASAVTSCMVSTDKNGNPMQTTSGAFVGVWTIDGVPQPGPCTASTAKGWSTAMAAKPNFTDLKKFQPIGNPGNCYSPPCPWETNQWPWIATMKGAPAGAQIVLMDKAGKVVSQAPIGANGQSTIPQPRTSVAGPMKVCIIPRPGAAAACGEMGDNLPVLPALGIQVSVTQTGTANPTAALQVQ